MAGTDTTPTFNEFYKKCKKEIKPGLKIVAFPTGMGKTFGAANSAIQVAENGDLPIFIAPRIAILKDFEDTVIKKSSKIETIRIIADTELKQVDYYFKNLKHLKIIANNIDNELINFISINNINLPKNIVALENYFSQFNKVIIKQNKDEYSIFKLLEASKTIKNIYNQFNLLKTSVFQEDIKNDLNIKLMKVFNSIIDIFEISNVFYIKKNNSGIYIDINDTYKIWGFNSFDKNIVKDFFGLTFALFTIKNKQRNDKYILTMTAKKSLKYIGRNFEIKKGKLIKIVGTDGNKLFFNKYINTFCHGLKINPVYYIDEADEFYNEIVIDRTKTIHLNNFLFKIKTFFDYSNISNLLSFYNKLENNKKLSKFSNDFKYLIFNYNNCFNAENIDKFISIFENNKISLNPNKIMNFEKFLINKINVEINNYYEVFKLFENINNKVDVLFLFLCFLNGLGVVDKINQSKDKIKDKLFLNDLYKTIQNSKDFFNSWHAEENKTFTLNFNSFFDELNKINTLLITSNLGETIINDEDFIELAEHNKFMFGNDSLSLVEEQIKYLDNLISVDGFSDNASLELNEKLSNKNLITLSYIFSFLTKVLIRTVQGINVPNENDEENTLDKEMSCHTYLKKMKTAFSNLKKIEDSQFKIKNKDLLFNEDYIYQQDKNVINLFVTNYDSSVKFGKPNNYSYIQMSNIHIKESPETEIINYFSIVENNEVKHFCSNSIIFLMSATSTINSYFGNFDYEYLYNQLNSYNINYDATYLNNYDIMLVNNFKYHYINKNLTNLYLYDYGIYENKTNHFDLFDEFKHVIDHSNNKSIDILNGDFNKYKSYEFQSFVYSIENLVLKDDINSLFFISQTPVHIINFLNFYYSNLLNKSSNLITKLNSKLNKSGKNYENIFIIDKNVFNKEFPKYNLTKDLIIIFYDSKFETKHNATIDNNDLLTDDSDISNQDLDDLDFTYEGLKKHIFNEDKYKILLCSSYGAISKGFNFVTNKNKKEKDFDAINLGMDPFYSNLSEDKDESLVYQRIVAMKDFNYVNKYAPCLNELMDYFYLNKHQLMEKEHLASISRVIIQALGRIERRRHSNNNNVQYLFINNETYNKMEKFYHFYDYERYINTTKNNQNNKKNSFSSNLSVNNQFLFDTIHKPMGMNGVITNYTKHVFEQINKNKILNELIDFLLNCLRKNDAIKSDFKYIWELLKSSKIFHNLNDYIEDLNNLVEPKLISLQNYVRKSEYPNLFNFLTNKPYSLSEVFFVKFPLNTKLGLSTEKCQEDINYDIIVDYNNSNKTTYDFFKLIFNAEKDDFSNEALKHIKWLQNNKTTNEIFIEKYTIGNFMYIPQRKIAIEFIKTAISEEIFKKVLEFYKFNLCTEIDKHSYELFDFFVKHNNKIDYSAIDVKFWSINTQALNSKNIAEKINRKTYITNLDSVKNILCVNLFGKNKNSNHKDNIYYKNFFIKNQVRSSPNYGQYILNQKIINFLKEEIEK